MSAYEVPDLWLRLQCHGDLLPVDMTTGVAPRVLARDRKGSSRREVPGGGDAELIAPRPTEHMTHPTEGITWSSTLHGAADRYRETGEIRGARARHHRHRDGLELGARIHHTRRVPGAGDQYEKWANQHRA
jgi:hypothetical protein